MDENTALRRHPIIKGLNTLFTIFDEFILVVVAFGIIVVAILLLFEASTDLYYFSSHSVVHIISDLMLVLIIMELFRQVMRQFNRHAFSLSPFIYIGFIASIRGILLAQMGLAMGELKWKEGIISLSVHAVIVVILALAYFIYVKAHRHSGENDA